MTFDEFERRAWEEWERIPDEYRAGIDGLVIDRAARPHPSLSDIYTLGECVTESYPSAFGDADTIRSVVVLYYGSFFRLARLDPDFDWAGELWETLTHELQHHLESLADDDALVDMDYAADENYKRYEGEPFDPFFFRQGEPTNGWMRVDDEFFLELIPPADGPLRFEWRGTQYTVDPPPVADVAFVTIRSGVADPPAALHLVVVRRTGWRDWLRSLRSRNPPRVLETDVDARPAQLP
jgi:hypothetical protein